MDWYKKFMQLNAIWHYKNGCKYHVRRSSSNIHTDLYCNTDYIICYPEIINDICSTIFIPEIKRRNLKIDRIITNPPYGIPISYSVAGMIGAKFAYIKDANCYFNIEPEENILIISDDIYSSASLKEMIAALKDKKAVICNIMFCLGNFSGKDHIDELEIFSIIKKNATFWEDQNCPMCRDGSYPVIARPNWQKLINELNKKM